MPTTEAYISKQVDRLCTLPAQSLEMFGVEPQDIRDELGQAIAKYARSNDHAKALVDWLLFERPKESRTFRPVVGEIREAAEEVAAGEERKRQDRLPDGCEICNGRPWVTKTVTVVDPKLHVEVQESVGVMRCSCARGENLKAKDEARKAEEKKA